MDSADLFRRAPKMMPTLRLLGGETFNMKVTSLAKRAVTFQPIA